MSKDRLWIIAAIAGMVVVAIGGWFLGISPVLTQAGTANSQASTIAAENSSSLIRLTALKKQFTQIKSLQKNLDGLRGSIPENANAAVFLQELNELSAKYGVDLTSVTVAAASVYQAPVVAPPVSSTGSSTATPTPIPTTGTATTTTGVSTTPTASNTLVLVPVSIAATGTFDNVRDFVGAVQSGLRLYLATQVTVAAGGANGSITATMAGDIFTLQGTSDLPATAKKTTKPINTTSTPRPTTTPYPTDPPTSGSTPTPTP